jgi:hypothetical protein
VVVVNRARAQRRKPHIVGVGAQFGTQVFLRRTPSFVRQLLHLISAEKAVIKAFYSPVKKIWFCRDMARKPARPTVTHPARPGFCPMLFPDKPILD